MGFNINFEQISLDAFEQYLLQSDLVPSRMILKEYAHGYFKILREFNIQNIDELFHRLRNKQAISLLADQTKISLAFLTILAREIKGYRRSPIKLAKFPCVETSTVDKLSHQGINNTHQLFNSVLTNEDTEVLASRCGIERDKLLRVIKLVDLSRVRWVNHNFACVLYEAGYDTAEKVAMADPKDLYEEVKRLNEERGFFPANIGLNDMKRCVEAASLLSFDIEYA